MRTLSWHDFDQAVERLATLCLPGGSRGSAGRTTPCPGIYGVPRGGLVLAVALSHRLELPLLARPQPACLLVDDVLETGLTLEPYRQLPEARVLVWISKLPPLWWEAAEVTASADWLVFPWENRAKAEADAQRYRESRG